MSFSLLDLKWLQQRQMELPKRLGQRGWWSTARVITRDGGLKSFMVDVIDATIGANAERDKAEV